jgi:ubiquitin fusion degradation protein 1
MFGQDLGGFFFNQFNQGAPLGRFEARYKCHSVAFIHRPELENGGKIILPPSALDQLTRLHIEYPMLFELSNTGLRRRTHAGVQEFVAEEGICYMPFWMMQNLLLEEGAFVHIRSTSLPRGTFVKFQPHTSNFLDISNPRAVLENSLRKFAALTKDDVIVINYNNRNYHMTVLETQPSSAISILETDISVDFAPPLDYKEPPRQTAPQQQPQQQASAAISIPNKKRSVEEEEEEDERKFVPFVGTGMRLDGKPATPTPSPTMASTIASSPKAPTPSSSPGGKLMFGARPQKPAPKDEEDEEEEEEEDKPKKFVPFSGKGYSLRS